MAGKRRRPVDRAIIFGGALGGLSREEVNRLLTDAGGRDVGESSYESVKKHYAPFFQRDLARLGVAIHSPPTWGDLKRAAEADGANTAPHDDADMLDDDGDELRPLAHACARARRRTSRGRSLEVDETWRRSRL
jgi:hypothetical protein